MKFEFENSYEVSDKIREKKIAVLPVGAVEAHGPHLPLSTDNILAEEMAGKLAKRVDAFVLPTLPYGQVWSLRNFPGSINVSNESLISILYDIGHSIHRQGFSSFVMMNGHLGNSTALKEAARKLFDEIPDLKVYYFFYPGMKEYAEEVRENNAAHGTYFHACEIETSYMLYLSPDQVNMDKAVRDIPDISLAADVTPTPWETFTDSAVLGDATLADDSKGEYILEKVLDNMVDILTQNEGAAK
ncbi:creatinine amidohydrolase [Salinicoccus sediminis]|uniref:Creatinine amidohydrolase n=1 Tax=Salinicoccus sediminis TaxID=1432562 RepID=A0A0M2SLU8_9STAP|nr:creatininase family protein [Salinicoccus sediminis]KKK33822.1 creatinine amidohydrolase [Salinicoccus sediminis]